MDVDDVNDHFPPETDFMTYVIKGDINGVPVWTLHDCDGRALVISDDMSSVFFYAIQLDCMVVTRH